MVPGFPRIRKSRRPLLLLATFESAFFFHFPRGFDLEFVGGKFLPRSIFSFSLVVRSRDPVRLASTNEECVQKKNAFI